MMPLLSEREKFIIIVDNDRVKKADVIILLEGDGNNRVEKAAELYKNKWAKTIIFSGNIYLPEKGSFPSEYIVPKLIENGVLQEDIIVENNSKNTREQAIEVVGLAIKNCWTKMLLVASHYHQYRAYLTFLKIIYEKKNKIELINTPADNLPWFEKTEWGIRYSFLDEEFKKIEIYSSLGHLATFKEAEEYQRWKEEQN